MQLQGKLMVPTQENGKKPSFGLHLGQLAPNSGRQNYFIELVIKHCFKLPSCAT